MVSSRLFPRLREPEVVELLEDLNLSVGVNSDFENAVCLVQTKMLQLELSCVESGKSDEPFQNSEKSDFFSN